MRSDDDRCVGREHVVMCRGSIISCCCAPTSHTRYRDYFHKGKSLKHGCRCTAAAAVLLLPYADFVIAHTPRTHTWYIPKRTNYAYTRKHRLGLSQKRHLTAASVPAGVPAVEPSVSFWAIFCKYFSSCCRSFFSQQPLLLTTSSDFVSYLELNFHRFTTTLSPERPTPPPAPLRRAAAAAAASAPAAAAAAAAAAAVDVYCVSF